MVRNSGDLDDRTGSQRHPFKDVWPTSASHLQCFDARLGEMLVLVSERIEISSQRRRCDNTPMGRRTPRYNAKARASSHTVKNAQPHPKARDGGVEALKRKRREEAAGPSKKSRTTAAEDASDDEHIVENEAIAMEAADGSDVEYEPNAGSNPLVLLAGQKGPAEEQEEEIIVPDRLSGKKKKRFEKFLVGCNRSLDLECS